MSIADQVRTASDEACERDLLSRVSRTFALTIPELPDGLREVVANAYLLCRAADTIEDDAGLATNEKRRHAEALVEAVGGEGNAEALAAELAPRLADSTAEAERELVRHLPRVVATTRGLRPTQRAAIQSCLRVMCEGMHRFQGEAGPGGLTTQRALDAYCYHVGGVVGELLTELFCEHAPELASRRGELMRRAVSFGQGLQMTNILKDQWEDRARGVCWLPRDVLEARGLRVEHLAPGRGGTAYGEVLAELIGLAHAHLRDALEYTLLIPGNERGIRRFCFWAIRLALETLGNIHRRPDFAAGAEVKVTRGCVANTILLTRVAGCSDIVLRTLFALSARGLPLRARAADWGAGREETWRTRA